ncbi:MAG: DUF192 domain-containing protein [Candidatus Aenigmarchaeota archaeon]|nr:DUF192 domain-containing protein [Candidatus Aenigmarchaeota archaeon]
MKNKYLELTLKKNEDSAGTDSEKEILDNDSDAIYNKNIERVLPLKTVLELSKGLMFKKEGRALLIFDFDAKHSIWMAFMRYSLDLVFINENHKIVDFFKNARPLSFDINTLRVYYPKENCRYVLEIESGFIEKSNLKIGDFLHIPNKTNN